MTRDWQMFLIAMQGFQLAFLLLHDWVPLGRLNDVAAIRRTTTPMQKIAGLLVPGIPVLIALALSVHYLGSEYPVGSSGGCA